MHNLVCSVFVTYLSQTKCITISGTAMYVYSHNDHIPSLSKISTVAFEGSPSSTPFGVSSRSSITASNVSKSSSILSSTMLTTNFLLIGVAPASNVTRTLLSM